MKKVLYIVLLLVPAASVFAVTGSLRPVNNTFVLDPGIGSKFIDANDLNFGGSGSLCVASATARAYDANEGIDHDPKGEFITLLKFDPNLCTGTSLTAMTLELAITSGNQSAKGIFNYLGGPGQFDLYWISNDWQQGYGTSNIKAGPDVGLTFNTLGELLDANEPNEPVYLETLYYDAAYAYWEGENWFEFELDLENENYIDLIDAIETGQVVTFMLMASPDSDVCFNLRAYVQQKADGTVAIRENGPYLVVETTLPFGVFDFDESGDIDHADLSYIIDHWHETGQALVGDIAPLGGDGVLDILDLTEFMLYWPESDPNEIEG